jgi:hypothetical protein
MVGGTRADVSRRNLGNRGRSSSVLNLLASYCFAISDFEAIGWERNGATARSTARGGRSSIASDEGLPPPQSDNYALKGDDLPGESTGVLHAQRSGRFPGDTEVASGSPRSPPWWGVCMDTD